MIAEEAQVRRSMYVGYYKRYVGYGNIRFTRVVRPDEDQRAYVYSRKQKRWLESEDHAYVWEDMDYIKIDQEEAERIIQE